jgi:hypothetical protein
MVKSKIVWILLAIIIIMALIIVALFFGLKLQSPIVLPNDSISTGIPSQTNPSTTTTTTTTNTIVNTTGGCSINSGICSDAQGDHQSYCNRFDTSWQYSCMLSSDETYYCGGKKIDCTGGQVCIKGQCVNQADTSCIDTDGGKDLEYPGTCVDGASSNQDACVGVTIREFDCVNSLCYGTIYNCPTGETCVQTQFGAKCAVS